MPRTQPPFCSLALHRVLMGLHQADAGVCVGAVTERVSWQHLHDGLPAPTLSAAVADRGICLNDGGHCLALLGQACMIQERLVGNAHGVDQELSDA